MRLGGNSSGRNPARGVSLTGLGGASGWRRRPAADITVTRRPSRASPVLTAAVGVVALALAAPGPVLAHRSPGLCIKSILSLVSVYVGDCRTSQPGESVAPPPVVQQQQVQGGSGKRSGAGRRRRSGGSSGGSRPGRLVQGIPAPGGGSRRAPNAGARLATLGAPSGYDSTGGSSRANGAGQTAGAAAGAERGSRALESAVPGRSLDLRRALSARPRLGRPAAVDTAPVGGGPLQPLQLLGALLFAVAGAWALAGRRSERREAFVTTGLAAAGTAPGLRRPLVNRTPPQREGLGSKLRSLGEGGAVFAVVIASILVIQALVIRPVRIPSESMAPTLAVGQQVLMERLTLRFGQPDRGDIVVFKPPAGAARNRCGVRRPIDQACPRPTRGRAESLFVKRVVGEPGDRLKILAGRVYIDGKLQNKPHVPVTSCNVCDLPREITVPHGHFFLMGDNRGDSSDSRYWGPVPREQVLGRAVFTYWPLGRFGPM